MIGALQLFDMVWVTTGGGPLNASSTMAIAMFKAGFKGTADGVRQRPRGHPVRVRASSSRSSTSASCFGATPKARSPRSGAEPVATTSSTTSAATDATACGRPARARGHPRLRPGSSSSSSRPRSSSRSATRSSAGSRPMASSRRPGAVLPNPWVLRELRRRPRRRQRRDLLAAAAATAWSWRRVGVPHGRSVRPRRLRVRAACVPGPRGVLHAVRVRPPVPVRGRDPAAVHPRPRPRPVRATCSAWRCRRRRSRCR